MQILIILASNSVFKIYFCLFKHFLDKNLSSIRTRTAWEEGENADHLTITTTRFKQFR